MWDRKSSGRRWHPQRSYTLVAAVALALLGYFEQVSSMPVMVNENWPTFPRRNIAALARDGYLRARLDGYKRSISTLAKNGQLPTFRAPYNEHDDPTVDDTDSHEKRNMASIARMRSYEAVKRNIQALARDGYRTGRGQSGQPDQKRNVAALARNGMIHKRSNQGDEYYFPFYQNPVPPLSEIDGPFDENEIYDYQQSVNPDMFPPLSQLFKRSMYPDVDFKRGASGMPVHGLYRPTYTDPAERSKRYILSLPDVIDDNSIDAPDADEPNQNDDKRSVADDDDEMDVRDNFEKRHIGSLARLGLLPSFRFSGGRYSRSGRARLLLPSREMYRKHSYDENFGIGKYFPAAEANAAAYSDHAYVPPPAVPPHSHPTGRILRQPLSNDLPSAAPSRPKTSDAIARNRWQTSQELPRFYYFRSHKVPQHKSGKRYLILPAVDNMMLRKNYPNSSLPSRRKNQ